MKRMCLDDYLDQTNPAVPAIIFLAVLGLCAYRMHSATRAVPVLNYHQINDRDENSLTVHTDEFDEQMKYLSDNGYHTITPEEMMDAWENGTPLPRSPSS